MIKIITGSLTQFFEKIEPETLILLGFFCGFNMPKRNLNVGRSENQGKGYS